MCRIFLLLLWTGMLFPTLVRATGQAAERLVVGRDTLQLFYVPLDDADAEVRARLKKRLAEVGATGSTACWRGYIGLWRLDGEGVLWLEGIATEQGDQAMTGAELLPEQAAGTRARAVWVTGDVRCGDGETVFYRHDGFCRHTEREWILTLQAGRVTARRAYTNRAYESGEEWQENARRLAAAFDTSRLGRLPDNLLFFVQFAADTTGRVVRVDGAYLTASGSERSAGSRKISDPCDPLLAEALRAFRAETRWDAWWIDGRWKEQRFSFPLRRGGVRWKPGDMRKR